MSERSYLVVIREIDEEEGGGFLALVPDLHGCMADGETREAAIRDIESAIGEWIDEATRLGREISKPGSAIDAGRHERQELYAVLKRQSALIKKQKRLLQDARAEVDRVQEAAKSLMDFEGAQDDEGQCPHWAVAPVLVYGHARTRRKARLSS